MRMAKRLKDRFGMPVNPSRVHLDNYVRDAGRSLPKGAVVLDAGAGDSIYRRHFESGIYESADFAKVDKPYAPDLTYVCDLAEVPVADGRYDLVVLTQVLEHLPEPLTVLREMRRVIKPGAKIWASCPFYFVEHEQPYDFYRYTQFALRRLFTEAGFADIQIDWLEGYWGTVGYQITLMAQALPRRLRPLKLGLRIIGELCSRRDLGSKRTDVGHPKNYTIIATAAY